MTVKDIKTARQRMEDYYASKDCHDIRNGDYFSKQEIADLRAYAEQLELDGGLQRLVIEQQKERIANAEKAFEHLERERDALKQRLEVSEAQAADLRQALSQRLSPQLVGTVVADERKAFEAWALSARVAYRDEQYGLCWYNGEAKSHQWIGWQARAKLSDGVEKAHKQPSSQFANNEDAKSFAQVGVAIPEGWALVPVEPTIEMMKKFRAMEGLVFPLRYQALLAAAPSPDQQG